MSFIRRANNQGKITLFLLLLSTAMWGFVLVLYENITVRIAHTQTHTLAQQLGRSLLSQFDPALYAYGLFGTTVEEANVTQMWETVASSQAHSRAVVWYGWTKTKKSTGHATGLYPLAHPQVFSRQIMEWMKLGTGIRWASELMQKWRNIAPPLQQATQMTEQYAHIHDLLQQRKRQLHDVWEHVARWVASVRIASTFVDGQSFVDTFMRTLYTAQQTNADIAQRVAGMAQTPADEGIVLPSVYFETLQRDVVRLVAMHAPPSPAQPTTQDTHADVQHEIAQWFAQQKAIEQARLAKEDAILQNAQQTTQQAKEIAATPLRIKDICQRADEAVYVQLMSREEAYRTSSPQTTGTTQSMDVAHPLTFVQQAFDTVQKMGDLFSKIQEEVLLNEYVLSHFTYRTQSLLSSHQVVPQKVDTSTHVLANQEVEYVLYGLPHCALNIGAAQTELYVFRTALRTAEAMVNPQFRALFSTVSPLTFVSSALLEGVKQAQNDVTQLLQGHDVALPWFPALRMNYKDHLRLFFALHSRDEAVLRRLQSVIEVNTGIDLNTTYSALRIHVSQTIPLWMKREKTVEVHAVVAYE